MYATKPISHDSVEAALAKVERYRLLNEPGEAESICRDILEIEPENQAALISLVLSLTDQIPESQNAFRLALTTVGRLQTQYDRAYYAGIAWERRAKARHNGSVQSAASHVYEWIVNALELFDKAESLRPPGNDDAILRWNACVRFLERHKELGPRVEEMAEPIVSE
jgi:hypothetical protein